MVENKSSCSLLIRPLVITACIIGILQGLTWTVMSILAISCHSGAIKIDTNSPDEYYNGTDYYKYIYLIFLNEPKSNASTNATTNVLLKPKEFFIFMWFYLLFSVTWVITSATIIWAIIHNQKNVLKYLLGTWSTITLLLCLVDLILTSLIGSDYKKIEHSSKHFTYGIVMTLAGRGYVLWIVNFIFGCLMIKFILDIIKEENTKDSVMPVINAFQTANENPQWVYGDNKDLWDPTPQTPSAQYNQNRFETSTKPENVYTDPVYNNSSLYQSLNNALGDRSIHKTSTLPNNTPKWPPEIPEPDYDGYISPNSQNGLKSVLKSNSNY